MNTLMLHLASKVNQLEKAVTFNPSSFDTRARSVFLWFAAKDRTAAEVNEYLAIDYNANSFTALLDTDEVLISFINDAYALSNALKSETASYRLLESAGAVGKLIAHRTPGLNPEDWVDIYQIVESATAMPQMITSSSAMAIVADSTLALDAVTTNPAALAYLVSTTLALDAIIENAQGLELFVATPAAVSAVIADVVGRPYFIASSTAMAAVINDAAALTQFAESTVAIDDIIADAHTVVQFSSNLVAMTSVINSEVMMPKFTASTAALDSIIANADVLNLFVDSSVAISALLADIVGRPYFIASSTAISALLSNNESVFAFIQSPSAVDEIIADIDAADDFISSTTAMGYIFTSSTAITAFLSDPVSVPKIASVQVYRDLLTSSLTGMLAVSNSIKAITEMTSSPTLLRDLLASPHIIKTVWQSQTAVQQLVDLNLYTSSDAYRLNIDMRGIAEIKMWLSSPSTSSSFDMTMIVKNSNNSSTVVTSNYISPNFVEYTINIENKIRKEFDYIHFYQDGGSNCQVADKAPLDRTGYSIELHNLKPTNINYNDPTYSTYGGQLWGLQLIKETV